MPDFPTLYLTLRQQEGRVLPDDLVAALPQLSPSHPLASEWQLRQDAARRVLAFLHHLPPGPILDLGCGNGWFTHLLSTLLPQATLTGMDIGPDELTQAARVFSQSPRLQWICADIFSHPFPPHHFQAITLGAAIQYFPDLPTLIARLQTLLHPQVHILIFDSPFYTPATQAPARQRTIDYYTSMGFPQLAPFYHHHTHSALQDLGFKQIYNPRHPLHRLSHLLSLPRSPFPIYHYQKP